MTSSHSSSEGRITLSRMVQKYEANADESMDKCTGIDADAGVF